MLGLMIFDRSVVLKHAVAPVSSTRAVFQCIFQGFEKLELEN